MAVEAVTLAVLARARPHSRRPTARSSSRPHRGARTTRPARPTASPPPSPRRPPPRSRTGKVIAMSYPLADGVPLFGTPLHEDHPDRDQPGPRRRVRRERADLHGRHLAQPEPRRAPTSTGMGHIGRKDCYYNQIAMGKFITQNNMTKLGLEHLKSFATRGVLVDMVKVFQAAGKLKGNAACKKPCLDEGHRHHRRRHPGRPQDVQRDAARGRHRRHPHRLGRPLRAVPGPERASSTAASPASARRRRTGWCPRRSWRSAPTPGSSR